MIYTEEQVTDILTHLLENPEDEVVEFKEANNNFSFNELGKYFSALSNEANLAGLHEAWLVFGVIDETHEICGTHYREQGNSLMGLKKEVASHTNNRLGFKEIYDFQFKNKRIVMFQISPAIAGIPTTWNDASYARLDESLVPLPMNKITEILSQKGYDWSKQIVDDATIDDLDPEAITLARKQFKEKNKDKDKVLQMVDSYDDASFLEKIGLTIHGKITNTALILLGKKEAFIYFDGFAPRITWTLYNADNTVKTYEHFDMPMILAVDEVLHMIRNVTYRYIPSQTTLFPEEVSQYDSDLVRELLHNCIAHQDYTLRGKINLEEFEDHLVFINEGGFIPETIETAMQDGYKAPYYRNDFLCRAMVNLNMIDTNSMGIPKIFQIQRERYFPLPTYDLDTFNRVSVTVYGKILDKNYTALLYEDKSMDIQTVFLLDRVQKRLPITKDEYKVLKKHQLVEGRYPNIYVSYTVAKTVGETTKYIKNKGLDESKCRGLIVQTLEMGPAKKTAIFDVVEDVMPSMLSEEQKSKRVSYILQKMKQEGIIGVRGVAVNAEWFLIRDKQKF